MLEVGTRNKNLGRATRPHQRSWTCVVAFILALLVVRDCGAQIPDAADVNTIKSWISSWKTPPDPALLNGTFPWTCGASIPSTFSFSCTGTRLTSLYIQKGYANTSIPVSVASLPLTHVSLQSVGIYGTVPAELFNPSFRYLNMVENLLWGPLPESILAASSLEEIILNSNSIDAIPSNISATSSSFVSLSLTGNSIKCLPAFTQLQNLATRNVAFRLGDNQIDFENTAATTPEILANRYSLPRTTLEPALQMKGSYAVPTTWDYIVTSPILPRSQVRVKGHSVYFFSRERDGTPYLQEYLSIELPQFYLLAIEQIPDVGNEEYNVMSYRLSRYTNGSLSSDGKFYILTAVLTPEHPGNESIVEFILNLAPFADEIPPNPADGSAVKYSLKLKNWYWPPYEKRDSRATLRFRLVAQLQLVLRTPHSSADSVVICQGLSNTLPGFGDSSIETGNASCSSRHLELAAYLDRSTAQGVIEFRAITGRLSVRYSSVPLYRYDGSTEVLVPINPSLHLFPFDVFGPARSMSTHNLPGSPLTPRVANYTQIID